MMRQKCTTGRCKHRTTYTTNPDGVCDRHPKAPCEHETKGRKLAGTVAHLASEREAARLSGNAQLAADLEHSAAMTKLAIEWNYQDHERECQS